MFTRSDVFMLRPNTWIVFHGWLCTILFVKCLRKLLFLLFPSRVCLKNSSLTQ